MKRNVFFEKFRKVYLFLEGISEKDGPSFLKQQSGDLEKPQSFDNRRFEKYLHDKES